MQAGFLDGIYIPCEQSEADTKLVRTYNQYTRDLTRAKNRIKGLLYFHGISIPTELQNHSWSAPFIEWLKKVPIVLEERILKSLEKQNLFLFNYR